MSIKISIIIPTYNHLEDCLKPCCKSIIETTSFQTLDWAIEVIVVANGCTDNTKEYIESLGSNFKLLLFDKPLGYPKAVNLGLKAAINSDYIILMNNDVQILNWGKDLWLNMLLQPFQSIENCGLTGSLKLYSEHAKSDFIVFFLTMISKKVIDDIGYLDEIFSPGSGEDIDYCMRAKQKSYQIIQVPNEKEFQDNQWVSRFPIYHKPESTVSELPQWKEIFKKNMDIIKDKYDRQFKLQNNYERAVIGKDDVIPPRETTRYKWARDNIYGSKILEIGCSSGYGVRILTEYFDLDYLGIDYDHDIVEYANEQFGDIYGVKFLQADANTFDFQQYDTIICFEVIEHLPNGKELVQKLKSHCKRLLVSVPYKEEKGFWGIHHRLHNLSEVDFPDFKYACIIEDGTLQKETIDQRGASLMLMRWGETEDKGTVAITPLYNDQNHILTAINSTQNQSSFCDHFIYDDASQDNSKDVVKEYINTNPNAKIRLFIRDVNKGQSYARNFLIRQALRDGYSTIAFLDSDDEWHSNKHIEKFINYVLDYDITYNKPYIHDGNQQVSMFGIPEPQQFIGKHLEHNNFIWISGVIAKAECFIANDFDSELNGLEDWDMWYRLFKQGFKFVNTNETTFKYFCNPSGEASRSFKKLPALQTKHKFSMPLIKLNIACGEDYQTGYINADLYIADQNKNVKLDAIFDVKKIPYEDNTVDEIRALHIIEHFDFHESNTILKEWCRALKPGGKLILETPDFLTSCKAFAETTDENFRVLLYGHFFAMPWLPGQTHKFLFTENQLRVQLDWAGFKDIVRLPPVSNYVRPDTVNLFLTVEAYKR